MSKIGRMPIAFSSAKIALEGKKVFIEGPMGRFSHELPLEVDMVIEGNTIKLDVPDRMSKKHKMLWGLHRALLANKVKGVEVGFETKMIIVGLGFKAVLQGRNMTFSLGYTHKIEYVLPEGVTVELDKTGQLLTVKAADKFVLGNVCDAIRSFRPPEPYKGTGIRKEGEHIIRKAGKTKGA